jgi:Uncharacterized FAD-dependent dehydrogenases
VLKITNFLISLDEDQKWPEIVYSKTGLKESGVKEIKILHRAVDARKKDKILLNYTLGVVGSGSDEELQRLLKPRIVSSIIKVDEPESELVLGEKALLHRPVVVGMGPAGLFGALYLARRGYCPIILERGKKVEERGEDVAGFWQGLKPFNSRSNVQFGEGGAGTFSDGKLTARNKDPRAGSILRDLVDAGAPEEILYQSKPHIGTDILRKVLVNLRQTLLDLGAEICFEEQLTELEIREGNLAQIRTSTGRELPAEALILAIGHSARDTYEMLFRRKILLEPKAFAVGLRIEHPQEWLNQAQYGNFANHPSLGAADYMLSHQSQNGRGVYTFCMCPGGEVVASASEEGHVVVNGMSFFARSSGIANSAVVASVLPEDWNKEVLGGIEFQRKWERQAFDLGGWDYSAPIQSVGEFLGNSKEAFLCAPTYRPQVREADLREALPSEVTISLQEGLRSFGRKIKGFDHAGAVLTGVETRTSAPVRILRDLSGESVSCRGLYPTGEGAGYAGGIVSAAIDGVRQAERIMQKYRPVK